MANLYEINAAMLECVDLDTGEIIDVEKLQALQLEREQKIENVALWIKNLLSDAAQYKAEKDAFAEKERAARARADKLKEFLRDVLAGEKFKTTRVNIYHGSSSVVVDDVLNLPPRFVRFAAPEPNKAEIMEAIKNGEEISGAHIERSQYIVIK